MDFRYLEELASQWLQADATDVFVRTGEVPRVRCNGELVVLDEEVVPEATMLEFWQACGVDPVEEFERDVRHVMQSGGYLRVNLYRTMDGLAAAIRPLKVDIPAMADLGVPAEMLREWMNRKSGIILVTGPTASGKSTTLASCLEAVNLDRRQHVVTIEDPIEYIFQNKQCYFSQREVNSDTGSFVEALRAALRQNPDIILIGEIRDEETAKIALRAAETGHLVLATLHSSGVVESMERITNLFPFDKRISSLQLLSVQLVGVLSQQLLPGINGGLQLVSEYLQNQGATRKWIREGSYTELADFLRRRENPNTRDLLSGLIEAVEQGRISEQVARNAAPHPGDFERTMRGIS
ncbi:ATPase, T2SS/T4P/T4SS family [Akkermansiaceae bacterium]|nr:ATPase, T2SS/T4P/T4SS family [Akkermansiaceae bacterium]MDB4537307.1 ATPase, T2SS/T4P/T4SS family [Akkermansiaceae bacterium]